ncbi:hypothetical protein F939_00026 [Acinetobacter radioresistens DSM 6976 = NBRC 102413 = CIP 103788]|uniref:hypothetical protein n=1 Tax=Acinetobacter radioresistens TaxID=40216 RepID=UPI00028D6220|nr:hypothetical protein [Acinetobacter radioresistens]ENV91118.1 hypothetical protein F939_00026 [Acinetobacter radioresistens DSM 6976 = NBRC 102413 = CIP 103788]BBL22542.1 hypothetical protein ACRAD_32130 [Acinetobacter radioresistens DSM 6976 = NBRC 102413 = CIP 103788]
MSKLHCFNTSILDSSMKNRFRAASREEPTIGKIVYRIDGLICNIFANTGTVSFQGKTDIYTSKNIEVITEMIQSINRQHEDNL